MSKHIRNTSGSYVEVRHSSVGQAIRKPKEKQANEGVFQELRDRKHFVSNTEKRLRAEAAGRARARKKQARDNW